MSHNNNICQQIWSIWQFNVRDQPIGQSEDRTKGKIEFLKYKMNSKIISWPQNTSAIVNTRFIKCLEKIKVINPDQFFYVSSCNFEWRDIDSISYWVLNGFRSRLSTFAFSKKYHFCQVKLGNDYMMLIDYYFIMIRKVGGSDAIRQAFGLTTASLKWYQLCSSLRVWPWNFSQTWCLVKPAR